MVSLTMKMATREDLKDLDIIRGKKLPKLHETRFKRQDHGKSKYYIFYSNKKPVGHVDVIFKSRIQYHKYPVLSDLYVKKSERGKGIGHEILRLVGRELKKQKNKYMSLDVETKEKPLQKFYLSAGFKISSGPHKQSWVEKDNRNKRIYVTILHMREKL